MKKILLIEDNDGYATLVKNSLEKEGYQFFWADNGSTGLQMALEHLPDLILLDLGLPDVDGQTLSTWIRAEFTLRDIPIVAMTAWPNETALQMVKAYQLNGYLEKGLKVTDLVKAISGYITNE